MIFDVTKLERILEEEVPYYKRTKWDRVFELISRGVTG